MPELLAREAVTIGAMTSAPSAIPNAAPQPRPAATSPLLRVNLLISAPPWLVLSPIHPTTQHIYEGSPGSFQILPECIVATKAHNNDDGRRGDK